MRQALRSINSVLLILKEYVFIKEVKFSLATLGNDAGICGAAKLVLDV